MTFSPGIKSNFEYDWSAWTPEAGLTSCGAATGSALAGSSTGASSVPFFFFLKRLPTPFSIALKPLSMPSSTLLLARSLVWFLTFPFMSICAVTLLNAENEINANKNRIVFILLVINFFCKLRFFLMHQYPLKR